MTNIEDGETADETFVSTGEQLKQAREAKGLTLDDVAAQTRIPIRHLLAIEREEWDALPAPTYAVGFARNYANAVGLDGAAIGLELRERLGGMVRNRAPAPEYYEPADPSRMPPKGLVIGAILFIALLVAVYFFWFSSYRSEPAPEPDAPAEAPAAANAPETPPAPKASATGPVTLTATGEVWLRIYEQGGGVIVERTLAPGESLQVPATARAPMLRVGAPESLRVTVGQAVIPQLGPSGQPADNISLLPQDLAARARSGPPAAAAPASPPPLAMPPPSLAPGNAQ